jgi:hypothetical protein
VIVTGAALDVEDVETGVLTDPGALPVLYPVETTGLLEIGVVDGEGAGIVWYPPDATGLLDTGARLVVADVVDGKGAGRVW